MHRATLRILFMGLKTLAILADIEKDSVNWRYEWSRHDNEHLLTYRPSPTLYTVRQICDKISIV